ncbi:MAG: hypothetical protein JWN30_2326 [Bacilli bacterium]|nr:hypothetical protein [Bacilli bacterium]
MTSENLMKVAGFVSLIAASENVFLAQVACKGDRI